ncbi:MAG: PD40 domain-containing protein, partial [Candidatus Dormibacteraeota bacterium]|nr:PD40 domain-containing protein [Candidatus Dormibacteraeota bacterium]
MKAHDLVYGLRTAGDPQLSPDGEFIVYALAQADPAAPTERPRSRLWRARRDGSQAVALTAAGGRHNLPRISPDGATVAFTSEREGESAVFTVPLEGGEPVQVAAHPFSITWLAWAPDSRRLAYTAPVEPEDETAGPSPIVRVTRRPDYKEDVRGYLGGRRIQAFVADVAERSTRQVSQGPNDSMFPVFSPDGRTLAFRSSHATGMRSHLVLHDLETGAETEVRVGDEATASVAVWSFSPTGDRILLSASPERIPQPDLFLYTIASGELERLTDDLEVVPDAGQPNSVPPSPLVWLDGDRVLLHGQFRGGSGLHELSVGSRALSPLTDWKATNVGLSTDRAGRWAVQSHASLESVGEISLFDRETGTTTIVTGYNTELLAASPAARWERMEVQRGEFTTEAWVLFPPGFDEAKRYPLVMDIHGGPHAHHGYMFNPIQQAIAGSGVIVVCPNPRG